MIGIIVTVLLLGVILFFSAIYANKPVFTVEKKQINEMSENALKTMLIDEAKKMRICDNGGVGINRIIFYSEISKAKKNIERKIKSNKKTNEAEKWFYENFYLSYRNTFGKTNCMKDLPHINGEPRIIRLMRIIVFNSLNQLNGERVRRLIGELKGILSLTYEEIRLTNDAISFCILECLYVLALRINYDLYYEKSAQKSAFNSKNITKDIYLYYYLKRNDLNEKERVELEKLGINFRTVSMNYNMISMRNTDIARTMFCALSDIESFCPIHLGLKFLGAYQFLSKSINTEEIATDTLCAYFYKIEKIGNKLKYDEEYVCKKIVEMSKKYKKDISILLFQYFRLSMKFVKGKIIKIKNFKPYSEILYSLSIFTFTSLFCVGVGYFLKNYFYALFLFIPLLFLMQNIIDYILQKKKDVFPTFSMNYKTVSYDNNTMVIISDYVLDLEQFKKSIFRAKTLLEGNMHENIAVSLLVDTKGGKTPISDLDREIISYCEANDFSANLNVFLRKKTYKNGKFIAKERKRGAIMAIVKMLVTKEDFEFLYIKNKDTVTPKYVITLDSDNTIMPGDVLHLVNMMSHPFYKDYDILSLNGRYNLFSVQNLFSLGYSDEAGFERYPFFSPLYYNVFAKSIFCGKGIIRLENFYNKMEDTIPSDTVLSHDILEGSILKTGNGTICFEDVPKNYISEQERRKRWLRGDIILFRFCLGRWKNDEKKPIKKHISPLYRYVMIKNFLGTFYSLSIVVSIVLGFFLSKTFLYVTLATFAAPYLFSVLKTIGSLFSGMNLRKGLRLLAPNILDFFRDFFLLIHNAVTDSCVFVQTLGKILAKKSLLDWKTFGSTQKENKWIRYVMEVIPSFICMTGLCVLMTLFTEFGSYFIAYAICFLSLYGIIFASERIQIPFKKEISNVTKVKSWAKLTYKFFDFMRKSNGLIADNLQLRPYKGESQTTSPTNIGFSLLAEICAYLLEVTSLVECMANLDKIVSGIEKLEKWQGNLFNWYNIQTGKRDRFFVSSVDNGNLFVSLVCVRNFCKQNGESLLQKRVEKIMQEMRLECLYDSDKRLFYIGFDGNYYTGHYDLYASEARILSLIFMAFYKDYEHFYALKKDYIGFYGNILLSWTGTMFETLMPELFFPSPIKSTTFRSAVGTVKKQMKAKIDGIWGVSESGYAEMDAALRYQYSAFGLKDLALNDKVISDVISPYACALAFRFFPENAYKNLLKMEEKGCRFEYGFYESIDYRQGKRIVYSAMAHHQGMILTALTDYLTDNKLKRIFLSDPRVCSVLNFYNDLQPSGRFPLRQKHMGKKILVESRGYSVTKESLQNKYYTAALCGGNYKVFCKGIGGGISINGDVRMNRCFGIYEESDGMFFFASRDGKNWKTATYLPFCNDNEKYYFTFGQKEIFYTSESGIEESVTLLPEMDGEVRKCKAVDRFQYISFYCDICLDTKDAYESHPAFRDLFVNIKHIAPNTILVTKRKVGDRNGYTYVLVRVTGLKNIEWECNRLNYLGRCNDLNHAEYLWENKKPAYPSMGDVLSPCIGLRGMFENERECQVTILTGTELDELVRTMESLPKDAYQFALQAENACNLSEETNELIGDFMFAPYEMDTFKQIVFGGKEEKFGLFTDWTKAVRYDLKEEEVEKIESPIQLLSELRKLGMEEKLIIYTPNRIDSETEMFVRERLVKYGIEKYEFIFGDDERKDWAFVVFDENGRYKKRKLLFNKNYQLQRIEKNAAEEQIQGPEITFESGSGGYDSSGRYFVLNTPFLPYSNVIGRKKGGIVTTENGGGFFYFGNSREKKCVRFYNDSIDNRKGEYLYVKTGEETVSIFGGAKEDRYVIVNKGENIYKTVTNGFESTVSVSMILDGKIKITEINLYKKNNHLSELFYVFYPTLSWNYDFNHMYFSQNNDMIFVKNIKTGQKMYVRVLGVENGNINVMSDKEKIPFFEILSEKMHEKIIFAFADDLALISSLTLENLEVFKHKEMDEIHSIADIDIASGIKSFDYLLQFLPYQIMSSRICAKAGFYQVGGATGFRDQLQDSLAFFTKPFLIKDRIIDACLHQYEEGDVMHWWHDPKFGLRSRITDDRLFLPYLVTKYIEYSGEQEILDEETPFLQSTPLAPEEKDRFENPPETSYSESVFQHCLRAIRASLKFGKHGLLIMGKGDWNDGMDAVCEKGEGESVFNSMFCYYVMCKFAEVCPNDLAKEMNTMAVELKKSINSFAFDKDRYLRLYSDDGRWLGSDKSESLTIDLLIQAFAVLTGVAEGERAKICMQAAKKLIDEKIGIVKLLSPPQTRRDYLGYISDYPRGIRENGGQYTHAAIWYLMALTSMGKQDEAFELFQMINPAEKCSVKEKNAVYMGEPYVLSGDVYSNVNNAGRCGWSWYTGSAGWAYKLVTEWFYGLKKQGNILKIEPHLPKKLEGSIVIYKHKNSRYVIEYSSGLLDMITVDGEKTDSIVLSENVRKKIKVEIAY